MNGKIFLRVSTLASVLIAFGVSAAFGIPTNGNFASGLVSWDVEYGRVNDGGGFALFTEDNIELSSTLSQVFTLEADSDILSFDLTMSSQAGGNSHSPRWADAFTASLLDPVTLNPLASNPGYTDFYYLDNTGILETVGNVSGNTVSLDVSAWANQNVLLSFDLFGSDDGMETSVTLDNVIVSSSVPVVPVPGALLLGLAGAGMVGFRRRSIKQP